MTPLDLITEFDSAESQALLSRTTASMSIEQKRDRGDMGTSRKAIGDE
jgi:hypothetical protein